MPRSARAALARTDAILDWPSQICRRLVCFFLLASRIKCRLSGQVSCVPFPRLATILLIVGLGRAPWIGYQVLLLFGERGRRSSCRRGKPSEARQRRGGAQPRDPPRLLMTPPQQFRRPGPGSPGFGLGASRHHHPNMSRHPTKMRSPVGARGLGNNSWQELELLVVSCLDSSR